MGHQNHILVYALGSATNRAGILGVDEFAHTLDPYGHRTTFDLKNRLLDLATDPIHAAIIGGGATGVEMAAQLKGNFPNIER